MSDFNFNEVIIDRVHRIHEYDLMASVCGP